MATRPGNRSVLLVVDVQSGVVASAHRRDETVANVAAMVEKARRAEVPVVWVQHSDDELVANTDEWELASELSPQGQDHRIHKHFNSSFEETDLESLLDSLGASKIVLAGAATNWCIRATAYGALERGYDVSLISDAHTTGSPHAPEIIEDLNTAMQWLSYPGRKNEAVAMANYSFGE